VPGAFIVFEGPEGSGKTTQVRRLAQALEKRGFPVVATREPGGTPLGDEVRTLLLGMTDYAILPETEVLLLAAARAQHVHDVIIPALRRADIVLCDRYVDSTLAYQVAGHGVDPDAVAHIQRFATGGVLPDLRILLDLPVEVGLARRLGDPDAVNRIDRAGAAFHQRVREAYLRLADSDPEGWTVIDAGQAPDVVAQSVLRAFTRRHGHEKAAAVPSLDHSQ
jgi:dTMP kinase